ncbi:MAG: tetratricopeptide repeat protein [Deltaproteobacteria bacterium]|nr:tetratricopeptide repeat protein [Deltaproteobacteria bacterium]
MSKKYVSSLSGLCLIPFTVLVFSTTPAHGQLSATTPPALESAQPSGEPDYRTAHQEAVDKLRQMPADKIAGLDDKLTEALTLYYDGKFAQALPIFNLIAADVETMDIMWWLGTSAMNVGETKLAIEKFQRMLTIDPQLHRVRLELAAAHFQLKQYEEARREAELVKQARPPEAVVQNIDRLLAAIEESTKTLFWNVRFSQGLQWDSNVSSGPDQKVLSVTGGTLTLDDSATKISDWASIENFSGNVLYDFGEKKGFLWNTTADVYNQFYFRNGKYNYLLGDFSTGLWWVGPNDIVKLPLGISKQELGSDPLSTIYHFRPSWEHYFTSSFSLKALYSNSKERFMELTNQDQNNVTNRYELTPNFYFLDRRHIVSLSLGKEYVAAEARRFSYTAPYGAISYYTRFSTKTDLFFRYQFGMRDYKAAPILYNEERVDRRHSFSAVVSQELLNHLFASLSYNYIENLSNLELFTFRKQTYTLSMGFYF